MGYGILLAYCPACRCMFACNPRKVPAIKGEPVCKACAQKWTELHPEAHFVIPKDAYEPVDEREL